MMDTMKVAAFIAKHPIHDERVQVAHAWAKALAYITPMFDEKAFVEACGVKYREPPMEEP